ncbi:hypothetical protein OSCI_1600055 [Kamptonema sp. PCC 6506]|nr:hypothetical protein OSCI_1600055 [Kamptonema sp. PCC 6506]
MDTTNTSLPAFLVAQVCLSGLIIADRISEIQEVYCTDPLYPTDLPKSDLLGSSGSSS